MWRGGKEEVQNSSRHGENCQSVMSLHENVTSSFRYSDVCDDERLTIDSKFSKDKAASFESIRHWCTADEFAKLGCVEFDLIVEGHVQRVESRGIDAGHEVLQVFTVPF
jgi:hypothetical protein